MNVVEPVERIKPREQTKQKTIPKKGRKRKSIRNIKNQLTTCNDILLSLTLPVIYKYNSDDDNVTITPNVPQYKHVYLISRGQCPKPHTEMIKVNNISKCKGITKENIMGFLNTIVLKGEP